MPSAFQRGPRTLPTAAGAAAAGVSAGGASVSSSAGSSSSPQVASSSTASSSSHTPSTSAAPVSLRPSTHSTLRPSPFPQQQPLPLFSLGLNAINDVLTGLGLPAGSLALFLPVLPPHHPSSSALASALNGSEAEQRRTAEAGAAYADLVVRYGAAQGLAARQRVMVVGEEAEEWTRGLMGWTGAGEAKKADSTDATASEGASPTIAAASAKASSAAEDEEDEGSTSSSSSSSGKDSQLKVAFRYEKLKRLEELENKALGIGSSSPSSSSGQDNVPYVHPFDLSMKMPASVLREARQEGRLVVHSLADEDDNGGNTYEHVWSLVKSQVASWRAEEEEQRRQWTAQAAQGQAHGTAALLRSPTPIRIVLPSLGSPVWTVKRDQSHAVESYRLLLRIKKLLRSSSWIGNVPRTGDSVSNTTPPMEVPSIALCSPSVSLLLGDPTAAIATRLATLADSALAFSSYSADPRLRSVFQPPTSEGSSSSGASTGKSASFTGALQIIKTPALGSLAPSSIRASQLRGLSSASGDGRGGGSDGENALGFKVRRKGFKVEVLGRDLVADWGAGGDDEDKKKKRKPPPPPAAPAAAAAAAAKSSTSAVASAGTAPAKAKEAVTAATAPAGPVTPAPPQASPLRGLAALRARGLRAAAVSSSSGNAAPVAVGEEKPPSTGSAHTHTHTHAHVDSSLGAAEAEAQERQAKREQREEQLRLAAGQDW